MNRSLQAAATLLLALPLAASACEPMVVPEHLGVDSASNYYLVEIKRAHGANLVGTVNRSFGGTVSAGQTVSIQSAEHELAHAICPLDFAVGQTYLLRARYRGGALEISRFNGLNIPADHERFATWVQDLEESP